MKNSITSLTMFLLCCVNVFSQDNIFKHNGYVAYSKYDLKFKKDYKSVSSWDGIEFAFGDMIGAMYNGTIRKVDTDSTVGNGSGKIFMMGYRLGYDFSIGGESFFSVGIRPFIDFKGGVAQVSNLPMKTKPSSIGLIFSPGIEAKISHLHLILKYDAGLYLGTTFWAGNNRYNAVTGFLGGLNLSIGIDNAFDLLTPEILTFQGLKTTIKKRNSSNEYIDKDGYWVREEIETTITSYEPGEVILSDVKPFFGVGPTYSFSNFYNRQAPTLMKGVNLGFRYGYWMFDGYYETGKVGLNDQVGKGGVLLTFPQLRNYDFSAKIPAVRYGGRIGFNFLKLLQTSHFTTSKGNAKIMNKIVPFTRFSAFYTYGVTVFDSTQVKFTYSDGRDMLSKYQQFNNIPPSVQNNPNYLDSENTFSAFGISLEFGSAFINYTWYKYKNALIANQTNFTVGANIPIGRIFTSVLTKAIYNNRHRKALKGN